MQLKNRYYPYPILINGNGDYIDSYFESKVEQENDGYNIKLKIFVNLKNDDLNKLIKDGYVKFAHHLECSQTCFRNIKLTDKNVDEIIIRNKDVNGKLQVCTFLVVFKDIQKYENTYFSQEFKGFKFNFDKGLIIGIANEFDLEIDKIKDDLQKTSSIISISPNNDENEINMKVDLNQEKIVILLPTLSYKKYNSVKDNLEIQPLMHSLVIIPALTYVLGEIKCSANLLSLESHRWYRNLKKSCEMIGVLLDEDNLDDLNSLEVAQKLIDGPLNNSFQFLVDGGSEYED